MDNPNKARLAPLTQVELAALPAGGNAAHDDGECVMPVPTGAPAMPSAHPKWGKPKSSDRWRYTARDGAVLFEVWRFDPPGERKQFPSLSLWRMKGRLTWRWKAVPEPRPLYGLDKLAKRHDASVIICEGEKSADAAARVFPNSVAVTAPGGSQAARKADWSPLAGRGRLDLAGRGRTRFGIRQHSGVHP